MFGIPVESTVRSRDDLPLVVRDTIRSVLISKGTFTLCFDFHISLTPAGYREEGIFRVSGSHSDMQALKQQYDAGHHVDLSIFRDPHLPAGAHSVTRTFSLSLIAGLLKQYLRELPETLLTKALLPDFQVRSRRQGFILIHV